MFKRTFLSLAIVISGLGACAHQEDTGAMDTSALTAEKMHIVGALTYRERAMLRPGHTLHVTLEDVSIADRKAPVIVEEKRQLEGKQVPLPFALSPSSKDIRDNGRYSVRGKLLSPTGDLVWTTETAHLIDTTQPLQDLGELVLTRVQAKPKPDGTRATFMDTEWVIEDVNGGGIIDMSRLSATFGKDGRLSGLAGCNSYGASFKVTHGYKLTISPLISTRKACAPALMDQEQRFLAVLADVDTYRIEPTGAIILSTSDGRTLKGFPAG